MARGDVTTIRGEAKIAKEFERLQQNRKRRTAGRDALETVIAEPRRGLLDESLDQRVVVPLSRSPEQLADFEIRPRVALEPVRSPMVLSQGQQLIQ